MNKIDKASKAVSMWLTSDKPAPGFWTLLIGGTAAISLLFSSFANGHETVSIAELLPSAALVFLIVGLLAVHSVYLIFRRHEMEQERRARSRILPQGFRRMSEMASATLAIGYAVREALAVFTEAARTHGSLHQVPELDLLRAERAAGAAWLNTGVTEVSKQVKGAGIKEIDRLVRSDWAFSAEPYAKLCRAADTSQLEGLYDTIAIDLEREGGAIRIELFPVVVACGKIAAEQLEALVDALDCFSEEAALSPLERQRVSLFNGCLVEIAAAVAQAEQHLTTVKLEAPDSAIDQAH